MSSAITYSPAFKTIDRFMRMHGEGSMAFSSLQPNLKYYVDIDRGYMPILYLKHRTWAPKGFNVILGDPICKLDHFDDLFDSYLSKCNEETSAFIHLSERFAKRFSERNYKVNQMGVEHLIDLKKFDSDLCGRDYAQIRRWRNKSSKSGVEVVEKKFEEINPSEFQAVNEAWLSQKGGDEFVGMTRPLRIEDKKDVRYLWAFQNGNLIGFAFFDPMYRDNKVYGYIHNIARLHPSAPHGTNDLIILEGIKKFQMEKIDVLSLGLSPLANIEDRLFSSQENISILLRFMFKHCEFIYPFKGNYFHKNKYRAQQNQTYMTILPNTSLYSLLGVFKTLSIF